MKPMYWVKAEHIPQNIALPQVCHSLISVVCLGLWVFSIFYFTVLCMEFRLLYVLSKYPTTELHPQPPCLPYSLCFSIFL